MTRIGVVVFATLVMSCGEDLSPPVGGAGFDPALIDGDAMSRSSDDLMPADDDEPIGCPACLHGQCYAGACLCDSGWAGASCNVCDAGRFGLDCRECRCRRGLCDDGPLGSGRCVVCKPGQWGEECGWP